MLTQSSLEMGTIFVRQARLSYASNSTEFFLLITAILDPSLFLTEVSGEQRPSWQPKLSVKVLVIDTYRLPEEV